MRTIAIYETNCCTIDEQFRMGFPSASIYDAWEDHSAELQYIIEHHLDNELKIYLELV